MSKIWGKIATQLQRSPSDISQRCAVCNCDMVRKMVNSHHAEDGKSYSQLAQKFNPRFVNLPQLWESAAAGCHGCRVLADTIVSLNSGGTARMEDLSSYRLPPEKYATCLVRYEPTGPGKHLKLEVKSSDSTANESYVAEIYHEEGSKAGRPFGSILSPRKSIPKSCRSEQCFETIRGWISECANSHAQCQQQSFRPRRLLDCSARDAMGEDMIVLVETKDGIESEKYVCLSYCWGKSSTSITTTVASYGERTSKIVKSSLPKTYKDAILITRALGLRYLWIDALCIVQDDSEDWVQQSSQMHQIYASSHITIGASTGRGSDSGILNDRIPTTHTIKSAVPTVDEGLSVVVYTQTAAQYMESHHSQFYVWSAQVDEPLANRAWAFQERFLSTRIVHFTATEMVMECKAGIRCECSDLESRHPNQTLKRFFMGTQENKEHDNRFGTPDLFYEWTWIIQHYTSLVLTYQTDILPALSGLARAFREKQREEDDNDLGHYHAGLWETHFPHCLAWYAAAGSSRCEPYLAPSWSWASVKGQVRWQTPLSHRKFKLVIVRTVSVPLTSDQYGQLSTGTMTARGQIAPFPPEWLQPPYHSPWDHPLKDRHGIGSYFVLSFDDEKLEHTAKDLFLLKLFIEDFQPGPTKPFRTRVTGLILTCCGKNTYRRVGYYAAGWELSDEYENNKALLFVDEEISLV